MRVWLLLCALLSATVQAGGLQVRNPYIRELPPGQSVSAGFFALINDSAAPIALVGASSDVAERVEMHAHRMTGGKMRMDRLRRVEVPAAGELQFKPGGLHLMLIGLKRPLRAGDSVEVTLLDEQGDRYPVVLPVIDTRR